MISKMTAADLLEACVQGNVSTVTDYLKTTDPSDIKTKELLQTALVASLDHTPILTALLKHGVNPNVPANNKQAETCLHLALRWENATAIETLFAHGANPNIANGEGLTVWDVFNQRKTNGKNSLRETNGSFSRIEELFRVQRHKEIKKYLKKKADPKEALEL
jgi:ankyrin repeat protein